MSDQAYSTPGIKFCRYCNKHIRILDARYPNAEGVKKRCPIDAQPVADGDLAISLDRLDWRSTTGMERASIRMTKQAYRFHECPTRKGAA